MWTYRSIEENQQEILEEHEGLDPLGFLANPQLSTDLNCLYQLPFELGLSCYSPQHDELSRISFGLKSQKISLSLAI